MENGVPTCGFMAGNNNEGTNFWYEAAIEAKTNVSSGSKKLPMKTFAE